SADAAALTGLTGPVDLAGFGRVAVALDSISPTCTMSGPADGSPVDRDGALFSFHSRNALSRRNTFRNDSLMTQSRPLSIKRQYSSRSASTDPESDTVVCFRVSFGCFVISDDIVFSLFACGPEALRQRCAEQQMLR